jgi:hypothetical protein
MAILDMVKMIGIVLLTRAGQGIVLLVPEGDKEDRSRDEKYYYSTYNYLESIGFEQIN